MSDSVSPALTAEEWESYLSGEGFGRRGDGWTVLYAAYSKERPAPNVHLSAALALYGQPFGFSWEDVDFLRSKARYERDQHGELIADAFDFDALADRIAALLPPHDEYPLDRGDA